MSDSLTVAERLEIALDLADLAEEMMLMNLARRYSEESDAQLRARLEAWMLWRPGAEHGDCEGRPVTWPRRRA